MTGITKIPIYYSPYGKTNVKNYVKPWHTFHSKPSNGQNTNRLCSSPWRWLCSTCHRRVDRCAVTPLRQSVLLVCLTQTGFRGRGTFIFIQSFSGSLWTFPWCLLYENPGVSFTTKLCRLCGASFGSRHIKDHFVIWRVTGLCSVIFNIHRYVNFIAAVRFVTRWRRVTTLVICHDSRCHSVTGGFTVVRIYSVWRAVGSFPGTGIGLPVHNKQRLLVGWCLISPCLLSIAESHRATESHNQSNNISASSITCRVVLGKTIQDTPTGVRATLQQLHMKFQLCSLSCLWHPGLVQASFCNTWYDSFWISYQQNITGHI